MYSCFFFCNFVKPLASLFWEHPLWSTKLCFEIEQLKSWHNTCYSHLGQNNYPVPPHHKISKFGKTTSAVTYLSISCIIAFSTQALVVSPDKLLSANRLFALITHKTFLMEYFALVSNLLLSLGKVTPTCLTNLRWCYATAQMANQLLTLKGEALI